MPVRTENDTTISGRQLRAIRLASPIMRRVVRKPRLAGAMDPLLTPFNPFSPRRSSDPYPLYERMRAKGPVVQHPLLRVWYVTGFDECEALLRSRSTSVDRSAFFSALAPYKRLNPSTLDLFLGSMLMKDSPEHDRVRNGANRVFSRTAIERYAPDIEEITRKAIADIPDSKYFDFAEHVAFKVPVRVLWRIFGVPAEQHDDAARYLHLFAAFTDPRKDFDVRAMDEGIASYRRWLNSLIDERRESETHVDALGHCAQLERSGQLTRQDIHSMFELLTIAGFETTSSFLGNCINILSRYPEFRESMFSSESTVEAGLEEILRLEPPAQVLDRLATEDIQLGSQSIKRGSSIGIVIGAANRDPRRFESPNEPRLSRQARSLVFGIGPHHCLGAALALLEGRIVLEVVRELLGDLTVQEDSTTWKPSVWGMRGPNRLVVSSSRAHRHSHA